MIYEFNGFRPVIHESAFIHPQAAVTGNVVIGPTVKIAYVDQSRDCLDGSSGKVPPLSATHIPHLRPPQNKTAP